MLLPPSKSIIVHFALGSLAVVVAEPNMGGALRKGFLRALGAAIGGGAGFFALWLADVIGGHDWNTSDPAGATDAS